MSFRGTWDANPEVGFASSTRPGGKSTDVPVCRPAGTSPDEAWVFYVSDVHRMNSGPMQQLEHFRTRSAITVEWLYQLYMALEADVWIGTRKSNWNRLIDEMRCVIYLLTLTAREWSQRVLEQAGPMARMH